MSKWAGRWSSRSGSRSRAASTSGRLALDEGQLEGGVLKAPVRVGQLAQQCLGSDVAGLLEWLADARQPEELGPPAVVEPDDRKIVGDREPLRAGGAERGRGQRVVVREDRRRAIVERKELFRRDRRRRDGVVDAADARVGKIDASSGELFAVTAEPRVGLQHVAALGVVALAEEGESLVAAFQKQLGGH